MGLSITALKAKAEQDGSHGTEQEMRIRLRLPPFDACKQPAWYSGPVEHCFHPLVDEPTITVCKCCRCEALTSDPYVLRQFV